MSLVQFRPEAPEKSKSKDLLFSIQSEGLACNLTAGEYVIAEGVWHHASACIFLRIDYIQHFVLIPYRRQAADFIHGFAVILRVAIPSYVAMKNRSPSAVCFSFLFLWSSRQSTFCSRLCREQGQIPLLRDLRRETRSGTKLS